MHYQAKTKGGYLLGEVISALQKEIRRGKEEEAMFWAHELIPHYEAYFWRRMIVIANEDIGVGNPMAMLLIPQLRDSYFEMRQQRGGNGSAKLMLANAVLILCRSPKSRLSDEFNTVVEQDRRHGLKREIPDYALDKHTSRGRGMQRGNDHWLNEGCQLKPRSGEVDNPYIQRAQEYWLGDFIRGDDWGGRPKKETKGNGQVRLFDDDEP